MSQDELRINERVRISPIRLIDENGVQVGIVPTEEARRMAEARGLDLVEVAPQSRPPVCRLMDYGKYRYEQARKARDARRKQHTIQVKEIKLRPKIEEHDLRFKLRNARRFLDAGDKVKFTLLFRGREVTRPELGSRILRRVLEELEHVAAVEAGIAHEGRAMTLMLAPRREGPRPASTAGGAPATEAEGKRTTEPRIDR